MHCSGKNFDGFFCGLNWKRHPMTFLMAKLLFLKYAKFVKKGKLTLGQFFRGLCVSGTLFM